MRTFVYVDGFNLYNRRLKHKPDFKWLDLKRLAELALGTPYSIARVNFYTARISGRIDPGAPARQSVYLNALRTIPEVAIHYGKFLYSDRWAAPALPPQAKPQGYVWPSVLPELILVQKAEEKGSDVNLGCHLVRDAIKNAFEVAVVITNDTDLVEPIRIAVREAGKIVGLLSPIKNQKVAGKWTAASPTLKNAASFTRYIHDNHLREAQLSRSLAGNTIVRPDSW
jgi:uncharacterized LabA/DUF88 family protein